MNSKLLVRRLSGRDHPVQCGLVDRFRRHSGVLDALVKDGVTVLIVLGTCGENNSLEADEKRAVLRRCGSSRRARSRSSSVSRN
jgi:hypothetical protein